MIKRNEPLTLLFTALSLLLMGAFVVFAFSMWQDTKAVQFEKLQKQNDILIGQSRTFFSHKTRLIAKTVQARLIIPTLNTQHVSNVFDYLLSATDEAAAFALLDTQGNLQILRGKLKDTAPDQAKSIVENVLQTSTAQLGYQYRTGLLGETYMPFYVPIFNKQKEIIAIVAAYFNIQGDKSLMQNFSTPDSNTIWFLGFQGKVRMTHPLPTGFVSNLLGSKLSPRTTEKIRNHLRQGPASGGLELEIQSQTVLANVNYLSEYQFISLNTQPAAELYTLWLERMKPVGYIFVIFLVAALLSYRIALRNSKRIIKERKQAEVKVKKLSKAIEQSPNSVVITDENWSIEYTNSHFNITSDRPRQDIRTTGHNIIDFPPYNALTPDLARIKEEVASRGNWFGERKTEFENKWYSFSISHITNSEGRITHYVTVVQDITQRKQAEAKLYQQANYDPLTELPNRRRAHENVTLELKQAWQQKKKVAILYLDIDNFKNVNDAFGHQVGDRLLQLVAKRIASCCKDQAQACHIGGDDFMIYSTYEHAEDIEKLAKSLLREARVPFSIESKQIFISLSIGIARYPDDSNDLVGLMKYADIALFESKKSGRNRYSYFNHELDRLLKRRNTIEAELRQALERNEVHMVYQSKNDIKTGHIIGFEALMRWNSQALGPVRPDEFIEIAEKTGLIQGLGAFALVQATNDLLDFQKLSTRPLKMAINLSLRQLNDDSVIAILSRLIQETNIDPSQLELEMTETLLAENKEALLPKLDALLDLGLSLSIDDFGTGYSSLSYLTTFPVSTVKIDRAFVKDMAHNNSDATLTQTIIAMAHSLGMQVVAEGIEDKEQLAMLDEYGCDIGQGYYFSKPLTKSEMCDLVETEHLPQFLGA